MSSRQLSPSWAYVHDLIARFPNTPSLTLAKKIMSDEPSMFTTVEAARTAVRYFRGALGSKHRKHADRTFARDFDEADYGFIKACAFAGDSYRQRLYRDRIQELLEDQRILREETGGGEGIDERAMNLILAIDRSIQQYANLSHRGRRDLPVAFAPKGVLQDTAPPEDEDIEAAIDGAL